MEKKYPKSAFKLFFKLNPIALVTGISNELLYTIVAQETVKLPNIKVGGLKKILTLGLICITCGLGSSPRFFFVSPTFTSGSLAAP